MLYMRREQMLSNGRVAFPDWRRKRVRQSSAVHQLQPSMKQYKKVGRLPEAPAVKPAAYRPKIHGSPEYP